MMLFPRLFDVFHFLLSLPFSKAPSCIASKQVNSTNNGSCDEEFPSVSSKETFNAIPHVAAITKGQRLRKLHLEPLCICLHVLIMNTQKTVFTSWWHAWSVTIYTVQHLTIVNWLTMTWPDIPFCHIHLFPGSLKGKEKTNNKRPCIWNVRFTLTPFFSHTAVFEPRSHAISFFCLIVKRHRK